MSNTKKLSSSVWVGGIILAVGSIWLFKKLDLLYLPRWVFSWQTLLIGLGLVFGVNRKFEGIGWLALILVGSFFLIDDIFFLDYELRRLALPIGIIVVGAFIVGRALWGPSREARKSLAGDGIVNIDEGGEDYFDITTVFGGAKKKVFSKQFKGGETTCLFGGTDLDLTQADIQGTVIIDVVQMFGGVKLIVPANWEIKSDITAILGGFDDKRSTPQGPSSGKKLVITGFVMFGGVEIKSYN